MHRTTILLPETLRREAESVARGQGISLSELIRRKLAQSVAAKTKNAQRPDPLFCPGRLMTRPGPEDVSVRHDDYLYGQNSKKRSTRQAAH